MICKEVCLHVAGAIFNVVWCIRDVCAPGVCCDLMYVV